MLELQVDGRAQGTGRQQPAIAEADGPVDDGEREIAAKARILQSVIHHDQAGAAGEREHGPGRTVARHHRLGDARQQQRLVAGFGGAMAALVDKMGAAVGAERAAIAAREEIGRFAGAFQPFGHGQRRRRLSGAADHEIADADDRRADARAGAPHSARSCAAVKRGEGRQDRGHRPTEQAGRRGPPESRRAHGTSLAWRLKSRGPTALIQSCARYNVRAPA